MYFHFIGIKEKEKKQYEIDFLIQGGDEQFIRDFLAHRGVVIISLTEFKEDPSTFGNIVIALPYNGAEIQILLAGEDLEERLYFFAFLGLAPQIINFVDKPIPEFQMKELIKSVFLRIKEENEKIQQEKKDAILREQQKYEEDSVKEGLKIINSNIDRIAQVIKAGEGIISPTEIKELDNLLNEMKKIRLGTNFNKMTSLILDSHVLVSKAEDQILSANDGQKFGIDKNSSVSNIDVIYENYQSTRISEKAKVYGRGLTNSESVQNILGPNAVFLKLLRRDFVDTFNKTSFNEFFSILTRLIEYAVLTAIITLSILWIFDQLLGSQTFSLYLLPALGWLGLLIYLFVSLNLKSVGAQLVGFVILVLIYWRGLLLLLNTFAM